MAGSQTLSTQPTPGPLGAPFVLLCTDGFGAATGVSMSGSVFETGGSVLDLFSARVMRYLGYQTWVAVQADTIYRTTDAAGTWAAVHGPDADLGGTVTKGGLHLVFVGGYAQLMIVGYDGAGGYTVFYSLDGVTWSKGPKAALTAQTSALQASTYWQGSVYATAGLGGSARTYRADVGLKTVSQITMPSVHATQNDAAFAVFNDRFFGIWTQPTGDVGLFELVAGAWVTRIASLGLITTFAADRKIALWVEKSWLYAAFMVDNPLFPIPDPVQWVWTCVEIDSALATTVRATPLAGLHGSETNTSRVVALTDGPAGASGSLPVTYLYFAADGISGTGVAVEQWNGAFAAVTALSGGNSVQNTWPLGVQYSGNVFWASGQRAVEYVEALPTLVGGSGLRWGFRLYSPNPSVDTVSVRGFQGTAQDEWPTAPLAPNPNPVLASPSAGTLVGQTITGLDAADNGATLFQVTWLAPTNGGFAFSLGEYTKTVLEVF